MRRRTIYPPGACVGCGQPTDRMPLCGNCCYVNEHDWDTWDAKDSHSQAVRERAAAWRTAYHQGTVPAVLETWARPDGFTGPCPECGSTTCRGWYKPDGNHLLVF